MAAARFAAARQCEFGPMMHSKGCLNLDDLSNQWPCSGISSSDSTSAPSESASAQGEPSEPELVGKQMSIEVPEGPLADMFEDSDEDDCPLSPSKSAKRRMRRRRQRDAIKGQSVGNAVGYAAEYGSLLTVGAMALYGGKSVHMVSPCSTRCTPLMESYWGHGIVSTSPCDATRSDASTRSPSNAGSPLAPATPVSFLSSPPPMPQFQETYSPCFVASAGPQGIIGTNPTQASMARPLDASSRAAPAPVGAPQFATAPMNSAPHFVPAPAVNPVPQFSTAPAVNPVPQFAAPVVHPAPQFAPYVVPMPPTPAPLQPPAFPEAMAPPATVQEMIVVAQAPMAPAMDAAADASVSSTPLMDPMQILFGVCGAPPQAELIARLQAAAMQTYED